MVIFSRVPSIFLAPENLTKVVEGDDLQQTAATTTPRPLPLLYHFCNLFTNVWCSDIPSKTPGPRQERISQQRCYERGGKGSERSAAWIAGAKRRDSLLGGRRQLQARTSGSDDCELLIVERQTGVRLTRIHRSTMTVPSRAFTIGMR